jgi:hypothetical protein
VQGGSRQASAIGFAADPTKGYVSPAMRLHGSRVSVIAAEMVKALTADGAIETEAPLEVQRDLESVLNEYIRVDQELSDRARDMVARRNLPHSEFGKLKRLLADEQQVRLGDDAVDYLLDQLVEILMYSNNVEELYVEDVELRRRMREPLRREAATEVQLEEQVRSRLKHVQEGTSLWEVEYRRMREDIKRRKGL